MIDKDLLVKTVEDAIAGSPMFLVEVDVTADNVIRVEIDSSEGVDVDSCVALTRTIESVFDRDKEDYELEVGSAGLTSPLKVRGQYLKYLGEELEILTLDGRKIRGTLVEVAPESADGDIAFTVNVPVKVKEPGAKRPVLRNEPLALKASECKYVRYNLVF